MSQRADHTSHFFSAEETFGLWRTGEQIVQHPQHYRRRDDYERAIAATLARLAHHTTVRELVQSYFDHELDNAFVETVIRCSDEHILDWQRIEDAAYWRRFRALRRAQVEGGG